MLKNQKGITLIALIITIIVMLILVGVTINVALNGGLFQKAETATKETEEKAILEEMLAMMDITDEGKINYSAIITKMKGKYGEEKVKYTYPNATITGKLGTYNYIVSETEIKIGTKGNTPVAFTWASVNLGNVDTSTAYKGYIEPLKMTVIVSFTEDGKVIMETNGGITEINAKDPDNIDAATGNLSFSVEINGTDTNIVVTMKENDPNIYVDIAGIGTITYEKQGKIIYSNEEVLKMLGVTNGGGTYKGTWTVLAKDASGNPTKLVSTGNVASYELGYKDPKAIIAIPVADESALTQAEKLERSIWSYKNAVTSLNTVVQEETGITQESTGGKTEARSIKIEDINEVTGEDNVNKGSSYGTVYNYYYNKDDQKVYSKYKKEDGSWSNPFNTGDSSQTFVDDNGNIVVVDSEGDEATLTDSLYYFDFTEEQKAEFEVLTSNSYWLASTYVSTHDTYAGFYVTYTALRYLSEIVHV